MIDFVNSITVLAIIIMAIRFILSLNIYEKIISFYFIFTQIIILILVNSKAEFQNAADIVLLLFLLELAAVLFLLFNKKKI